MGELGRTAPSLTSTYALICDSTTCAIPTLLPINHLEYTICSLSCFFLFIHGLPYPWLDSPVISDSLQSLVSGYESGLQIILHHGHSLSQWQKESHEQSLVSFPRKPQPPNRIRQLDHHKAVHPRLSYLRIEHERGLFASHQAE